MESFPPELMWQIFLNLPYPELYRLRQMPEVEGFWNTPSFWLDKIHHDFGPQEEPIHHPQLRYVRLYTQQIGCTYGSESFKNVDDCLIDAVIHDDYSLAIYFADKSACIEEALRIAVSRDNFRMVQGLYRHSNSLCHYPDLEAALTTAIAQSHNEIAAWVLQRARQDLDDDLNALLEVALGAAIESNNRPMISSLLEAGANPTIGLDIAVAVKNYSLVNLMLEAGATNFERALNEAAKNGSLRLVIRMISLGATNINEAFIQANRAKQWAVVSYLLQYYRNKITQSSLDQALFEVSLDHRNNEHELIQLLKTAGARDLL
jgi:ankyrin repeat protein